MSEQTIPQLTDNQKLFMDFVRQYLEKFGIFKELGYFYDEKDQRFKIFASPQILFKDIVKNIPKEQYPDVGFSTPVPDDEAISDQNALFAKVFYACKDLLWAYISGGREAIEEQVN